MHIQVSPHTSHSSEIERRSVCVVLFLIIFLVYFVAMQRGTVPFLTSFGNKSQMVWDFVVGGGEDSHAEWVWFSAPGYVGKECPVVMSVFTNGLWTKKLFLVQQGRKSFWDAFLPNQYCLSACMCWATRNCWQIFQKHTFCVLSERKKDDTETPFGRVLGSGCFGAEWSCSCPKSDGLSVWPFSKAWI